MKQYEYKIVVKEKWEILDELNKLGKLGWELICKDYKTYFLKREILSKYEDLGPR